MSVERVGDGEQALDEPRDGFIACSKLEGDGIGDSRTPPVPLRKRITFFRSMTLGRC
jgi:hypothetical protein